MSAQIFQFSTAPRRLEKIKTSTRVGEDIGDNLPAEIDFRSPEWKARKAEKAERAAYRPATAINSDLRKERRDAWWHADRVADYWRARLDWHSALSIAQQQGIGDSASFASVEHESRYGLVEKWREAVAKKLLTQAPDLAAITWKRAQIKGRLFSHLPITRQRAERVIAEDVAFLAAHPTRKSAPMSNERKEERRAFKEAMRQRIREIAASRDIPDDEIRPVLSLKHRHIVEFATNYSVNFEWLLEGIGPMFKAWPKS
jgi:hypothetical protein